MQLSESIERPTAIVVPVHPRPVTADAAPAWPVPRQPRYYSLDLWRGIACLFVLIHHSVFYAPIASESNVVFDSLTATLVQVAARLWIGVPIFFVISGYCIAASADATRRRPRNVANYFFRRFRRIYPPFWFVLLPTALMVGLLDWLIIPSQLTKDGVFLRPWWLSIWQWLGNLSLTEIWRYHLVGGQKALYLGHAWTLCYEEQFYAVVGVILLLWPRRFFSIAMLITVATLAVIPIADASGVKIDGFFFDGQWVLFAGGVAVYYIVNYASRPYAWALRAVLALGVVFAIHDPVRLLAPEKNTEQMFLVASCFALLISAIHRFDAKIATSMTLRPLMLCGTMCYSLYLVHLPIARLVHCIISALGLDATRVSPFFTVALCSVISLMVAWLFYRVVERRFLSPAQRIASREAT